jgi:hypothetical protein
MFEAREWPQIPEIGAYDTLIVSVRIGVEEKKYAPLSSSAGTVEPQERQADHFRLRR